MTISFSSASTSATDTITPSSTQQTSVDQVDFDGCLNSSQGIDSTASAKQGTNEWTFPPSNAPEEVKQAWDAACKKIGGAANITLLSLLATAKISINGAPSIPSISPNVSSYKEFVQQALQSAKFSSQYDTTAVEKEDRQKEITGLNEFLDQLNAAESSK